MKQAELTQELLAAAELSYDQLDGEWLDWLLIAKRYEHKVPSQDRYDIRHTIILELAKARRRDGKPIPLLRGYRIASLVVALYWREQVKHQVKVCIYDGVAKELHCQQCRYRSGAAKQCPYLALRPVQSLDDDTTDQEGNGVRLIETVADDHAIDLDAWLDDKKWLLGCPTRLVQIAYKRLGGIPLNSKDQRYFTRQRQKELKRYQLALP